MTRDARVFLCSPAAFASGVSWFDAKTFRGMTTDQIPVRAAIVVLLNCGREKVAVNGKDLRPEHS